MEITKILVPVDGSEHSMKAAKYALGLASMADASLVLLHCHRTVPKALGSPNADEYLDRIQAHSNEVLKPFADLYVKEGADFISRSVGGRTAEVVIDVAMAEKCNLIVMGSKGKSNLEGLLMGSMSHKVTQLAPCPVLIVR